jgi:hypothetical protein
VNQSITIDVQQVVGIAAAAGMFPNLCTIQSAATTINAMGAPVVTPFANMTGLVDIPCHSAPPAIEDVRGSDELRKVDRTDTRQMRHVLLAGYFPTIALSMRAVVDGVAWNIVGVESDAFDSQTRLMVQDYEVAGQ